MSPLLNVMQYGIMDNDEIAESLSNRAAFSEGINIVAIESIVARAQPFGNDVRDSVFWEGRFHESVLYRYALSPARVMQKRIRFFEGYIFRIPRHEVQLHLCGTRKARDSNIRQRIIDLYGGKETAIGTKKKPGPLYGVKKDVWQALGLALTAVHKYKEMGNG